MNDDHAVANPQPVFEFPGTAGCRITAWPEAKVPVWAHWRSVLVIARGGVVHSGIVHAGKAGRKESRGWAGLPDRTAYR
jgi:hypothetical protein